MTKTKKSLFGLVLTLIFVLTMSILYGCDNSSGEKSCTVEGHGYIKEHTDENGKVTYTAEADEWNVFTGWYDGLERYSTNKTIQVNNKTPNGLVARFETSGTISADRLLNGMYHRFGEAIETEEEYFNISYNSQISIDGEGIDKTFLLNSGGYISLNGDGFNAYTTVKEESETVFASYYTDNTEKPMLYLDLGDRKVAVEDFESIGKQILSIPNISNNVWKLQNLLDRKTFATIDGYIGFSNTIGLIADVENSENQTRIVLKIDKLLNELKDKIAYIEDPNWAGIKQIVESLTNQYVGIANILPKITFALTFDYEKVEGVEKVIAVAVEAEFEEGYKTEISGTLIEIPASTIKAEINDIDFGLSNVPNSIPEEIISLFPEAVHAINVHADGKASFLKQNVATLAYSVIDEYTIDLDADINYNFIKDAIEEDGDVELEDIDWNNFGFLSLKMLLVENPEDKNQSSRHNGSTEYLNILIDTKKYGAKAFVYIDLFNPKTLGGIATSKYILNGCYDLEELTCVIPKIVEALSPKYEVPNQPELASRNLSNNSLLVADFLSQSIACAVKMSSGEVKEDEALFDIVASIINTIMPNNDFVQEGVGYSEFGVTVAVEEIKKAMATAFAEANGTLASLGLHNNIFGENTTHIAVSTNDILYGAVVKNTEGEYIDQNAKEFSKDYNERHNLLVGVAENSSVPEFLNLSFTTADVENEVNSLLGTSVTIEIGLFADGTTSSTFENCQGNQATIAMKIYSVNYEIIEDGTIEISVCLTFATGTLQSLLVNTFDIPYGLIEYSFTAKLS